MNERAKPPKRHLHLTLDLHADDLGEVRRVLNQLDLDFMTGDIGFDGDSPRNITSGGFGSGYHLVLERNPGVDHDSYIADLDAWLADDRAAASGVSLHPEEQPPCPDCNDRTAPVTAAEAVAAGCPDWVGMPWECATCGPEEPNG